MEQLKKQLQRDQERHEKALADAQKIYNAKVKHEKQIETIRQKMKDIRKDIAEANEIAKFMNKDVTFTENYVSKFYEHGLYGNMGHDNLGEQEDEV